MKRLLIVAAIVLSCAVTIAPRASAQSAMFTYTGVPAGPVLPGTSFTIGINIVFTSGGTVGNFNGLSCWFAQQSPLSGFPFSITGRELSALFIPPTIPPVFPQILDPINRNPSGGQGSTDLGGLTFVPQPSGTYPFANLTFMVAANAVPGSYVLRNTTSTIPGVGGRISVFNDSDGDTAPIAASPFNVAIVPEPSSIALVCVGLISAGAMAYRRRAAARQ